MRSLLALQIRSFRSLRCFTTTSSRQMQNRVLENQKIFQADNDLPVHLKKGTTDIVLYRFTMIVCCFGVAYALYSIYGLGQPKKND